LDDSISTNSSEEQLLNSTSSRTVSPAFSIGDSSGRTNETGESTDGRSEREGEKSESEEDDVSQPNPKVKDMGEFRRNLVKHLQEKRDSKLTKKRSLDESIGQLLTTAKEEVVLKKRAVDMMEEADKKRENDMQNLKESISSLTSVISNGFTTLQGIFQQPMMPQNQHHMYDYGNQQNINMQRYGQPFRQFEDL
jgi:hypothetical protein